ncbi:MAG: glycosyl transferase family 2 [Deltaproteobacteria bacterium DG_8]|nr:MAG: glycosyl transferase family 2 [Deltaproteobacteria bacterium DG_8]
MSKTCEKNKVKLSVVIPLYNEEKSLEELYNRIILSLQPLSESFELIFVDDGSTDNSFSVLRELYKRDNQVKAIRFRRNFGKAAALSVGFKEAQGEIIVTLDADLQDLPEEIPALIKKMDEGYDLVSGWKFKRKDPFFKKIASRLFNSVTSFYTGVKIHDFNCGLKCYRREVIEEIELYGELHRYIPAIANWKGFKVGEEKVNHQPRVHGKSKFGSERYLRGLFDLLTVIMLTKYPQKPLHFFGLLGTILSIAGLAINIYMVALRLSGKWISNRPLLLLGILLLILGVQFIFFGLMGELIVFSSQKDILYVVKEKLDSNQTIHQ